MAENEIKFDLPYVKIYKDGKFERTPADRIPAGIDPITNVQSKDVSITPPDAGVTARLFMPKISDPQRKLPLLIYFHGGAFIIESPYSPTYHSYLTSLVQKSQIIAISVDYRLAPEYPLPAAYDDSWAAIRWVAAHSTGSGHDPWLNQFADFEKVFFAGDSAGANIANNMGIRVGSDAPNGLKLVGIILVHPYFGGVDPIGSESNESKGFLDGLWLYANPNGKGLDDPDFNPGKDSRVSKMGCKRILVCVAEEDTLKDRGVYYGEVMSKSGWEGKIEVVEHKNGGHVFHLINPNHENAMPMMETINAFLNAQP